MRVLEPSFSTKDATESILVTVLAMGAEMESEFIRSRQVAGIAAAKSRGVYKGRKPTVPVDRVRKMHTKGQRPSDIAKALGISRMSVYRALKANDT